MLAYSLSFSALAHAQTQQSLANRGGFTLERDIEQLFKSHHIEIIPARDWDETRLYRDRNLNLVVRNAPYRSIYGHRATIEFLWMRSDEQVLIEAKRQSVSGSTDEKLPYVVANAKLNIADGRRTVLVIDGDGWKTGALRWIRAEAEQIEGFDVMRLAEFEAWLAQKMAARERRPCLQ